MINDGNGLHGSQFLITLTEGADSLNGNHSVFGEIAEESYDTLRKINEVFCDNKNVPYQVLLYSSLILLLVSPCYITGSNADPPCRVVVFSHYSSPL